MYQSSRMIPRTLAELRFIVDAKVPQLLRITCFVEIGMHFESWEQFSLRCAEYKEMEGFLQKFKPNCHKPDRKVIICQSPDRHFEVSCTKHIDSRWYVNDVVAHSEHPICPISRR